MLNDSLMASIITRRTVSGRQYHDPELAGAGDVDAGGGGGGGGKSVRRLDFQARRAAGGRRERFWRGCLCLNLRQARFFSAKIFYFVL
jgi:hypothetical protein